MPVVFTESVDCIARSLPVYAGGTCLDNRSLMEGALGAQRLTLQDQDPGNTIPLVPTLKSIRRRLRTMPFDLNL
jgi:hypothetical protein